jgi:predicted nucleic acid-binding protein
VAFVLDASVSLAWFFVDEASTYTEGVLEFLIEETAIVAVIWPFEVANALLVGERRRRLNITQADAAIDQLLDLLFRGCLKRSHWANRATIRRTMAR